MFKSNYHTHTYRCGHAEGRDEEYVLEAIGSGYNELGFSDHVMLPGYSEPNIRGDYELCAGYLQSIGQLRAKYRERIKLHLGFEAEGFAYYFPYYNEMLQSGQIDYLILGNHCMMNDRRQIIARFGQPTTSSIFAYRDTAIAALKTNCFSVFAHPDYFMSALPVFDRDVMKVARSLIETAVALDVPLEVNVAGIRNGKKTIGDRQRFLYPNPEFFKLARRMGARFVLGVDAHAPAQLADDDANCCAVRFCKELDLPLCERIELKRGKEK